jgi:hypothetical protein
MSGMIRRFGKGMKRTFEFMEHEVEPLTDMAGGDIEMGVLGEEALVTVEALAAVAAVPIAVLESPIVAAAGGVAMLLGLGEFFPGKRKRSPSGVIIPSAGGTSRAPPPKRPRVPGPSKEMPARRKVSKKGKVRKGPKAKTQKSKRTVKKKTSSKKKPKKKVSYTVNIKQEVHGKFRRKNVSYFGFQATAGMDELFRVAADGLMRAFLKRHHVGIRSTDEAVPIVASVPAMSRFLLGYRRTKYDDGTDGGAVSGTVINFASGTYESHVTSLSAELQAKARLGYYPYVGVTQNSSGNSIVENRKVGDAKLALSVTRVIKLRNITKNDDAGDTLNSLDTNPIQGRLYKFRHDTPRVTPSLYETDPTNFSKFHDRLCTAGVIFGPQRNATGDNDGAPIEPAIMAEDRVLSSPPAGGRVWDNLSSSKKIAMAPGQAAQHKMSFKFQGTVRQFLAKFATSAYETPSIGYCHVFGFEQKFKTDANDEINVEYDCDDVLKSSCVLVREDMVPSTVITHHAHNSVYA